MLIMTIKLFDLFLLFILTVVPDDDQLYDHEERNIPPRMLLGKERTPSGHLMHGAHACLVPVNYATTNVCRQLEDKKKAALNTRSWDYSHLMLLLPFILFNLFKEEVDEHNSHHCSAPVIDPSEELIGVTNVFLRWYKLVLFHQTIPANTPKDISNLRSLSHR
jgi:hypothetical protein